MKTLVHGTDIEKSREYFYTEKNKLMNPIFLEGEGLTFDNFFQAAENKSLFEEQISVILENFLTKNKSNSIELKKIVEFINNSKHLNLILWEPSEISKTTLLQLKGFEVNSFMIPRQMFAFLDQIKPGNSDTLIKLFHELRQTEEPELIFFMLTRQFRLFLQVAGNYSNKIDEIKRMQPWQLSKLNSQSKLFSKEQLIDAYNKLFEIEISQKTGKGISSIDASIDFFLSGL